MNDLLKEFFALQEERVRTCKTFDQAFQDYLKSHPNYDFTTFKLATHEATEKFNEISKNIRRIEDVLNQQKKTEMAAGLIRNIQQKEKEKLEMTAKLQVAQQQVLNSPSEYKEQIVKEVKARQQELISEITDILEELRYETFNEAEDV